MSVAGFGLDGKAIVTGTAAGTIQRWEMPTGLPIGRPMRQQGRIRALAFSPDGKSIVSGSEDHTARLWDTTTGLPIGQAMRHAHIVQAAAFSPTANPLSPEAGTGRPGGGMPPPGFRSATP